MPSDEPGSLPPCEGTETLPGGLMQPVEAAQPVTGNRGSTRAALEPIPDVDGDEVGVAFPRAVEPAPGSGGGLVHLVVDRPVLLVHVEVGAVERPVAALVAH